MNGQADYYAEKEGHADAAARLAMEAEALARDGKLQEAVERYQRASAEAMIARNDYR